MADSIYESKKKKRPKKKQSTVQDLELKRLRRRMLRSFFGVLALTYLIGAAVEVVLVDGLLQDPFARFFVAAVQLVTSSREEFAIQLYQGIFLQHKGFWTVLMLFVIFLVLFLRMLRRYTEYFRLVDDKLDEMLEDQPSAPVELPAELEFMGDKLERIKSTLRERQRAALESEQRKNDLVVYLAHDIKTPLTSVIGYLSLLDEAPDMPPEQRAKYTNITLEKAYRLEALINEFFEITRFNLQHIELERETVRLDVMLAQLADEFYPILAQQDKQTEIAVEPGLTVFGDPDKLARVFNNILKNAAAYSFAGSTIEIAGRAMGGRVVVAFRNRGRPIPAHQLEAIFEKFYRLDAARSTNSGGAGLGLAIAKEIVTLHGGTITAQSDAQYTTFTVALPAGDGAAAEPPPAR